MVIQEIVIDVFCLLDEMQKPTNYLLRSLVHIIELKPMIHKHQFLRLLQNPCLPSPPPGECLCFPANCKELTLHNCLNGSLSFSKNLLDTFPEMWLDEYDEPHPECFWFDRFFLVVQEVPKESG